MAPNPKSRAAYGRDWVVGEETLRDAARRHLTEIPIAEADAGDVLLFRYREAMPARHCGILVSVAFDQCPADPAVRAS